MKFIKIKEFNIINFHKIVVASDSMSVKVESFHEKILDYSYWRLFQKFIASVKPSNNWGPKDPISRHNWVQWNSKAQQGEKDFTLKRKGTKDYTRSVKKARKLINQAPSDLSTASVQGIYKQEILAHWTGGNVYNELPEIINSNQRRYHTNYNSIVTSETNPNNNSNSMEMDRYDQNNLTLPNTLNLYTSNPVKRNSNPFSHTYRVTDKYEDGSLRKGPYIISDQEVDHICFRKSNENNDVSEL